MNIRKITFIALMAAVCCILGPLSIPIGQVPISLQILAVFLCVYLLGWKDGTIAFIVYILLGLVGLPVFAGFTGGPDKLLGPTGGYILGFILTALIAGIFIDRSYNVLNKPLSVTYQIAGMILGVAACYVLGTAFFMAFTHMTLAESLALGVIRFIPVDLLKVVIAFFLGNVVRAALMKAKLIER